MTIVRFSSFCRDRRKQPHRNDMIERAVIVDRYRIEAHSYAILYTYEYGTLGMMIMCRLVHDVIESDV